MAHHDRNTSAHNAGGNKRGCFGSAEIEEITINQGEIMADHPQFKGYRSYDVMVAHSDQEGEWITVEAESKHDAEKVALEKFPNGEVLEVQEQ